MSHGGGRGSTWWCDHVGCRAKYVAQQRKRNAQNAPWQKLPGKQMKLMCNPTVYLCPAHQFAGSQADWVAAGNAAALVVFRQLAEDAGDPYWEEEYGHYFWRTLSALA